MEVHSMSKININDYNENMPYRKKRNKPNPKKSNHKHIFKPFIGITKSLPPNDHYVIAEECEICQKQRIKNYLITAKVEDKPYRVMLTTLEEIKKLYPTYEVKVLKE